MERLDDLDASHAGAFLDHLATEERLAAGTRNQAVSALAFMFREVFGRDELHDVRGRRAPSARPWS